MSIRSTRYLIMVDYRAGWTDTAQANSRRVDAIKRAQVITKTWNTIARVYVLDRASNQIIFDQTV